MPWDHCRIRVTHITLVGLNLAYVRSIKTSACVFAGVTGRIRTMTSNFSLTGIKAFALGAATLSMTAGLALAGDNVISADQITRALQPKPVTRGLSAASQIDTATQAKETKFVDSLRNRKSRSLSLGEREEIAQIASAKPNIDLEIRFDYNSADISKDS